MKFLYSLFVYFGIIKTEVATELWGTKQINDLINFLQIPYYFVTFSPLFTIQCRSPSMNRLNFDWIPSRNFEKVNSRKAGIDYEVRISFTRFHRNNFYYMKNYLPFIKYYIMIFLFQNITKTISIAWSMISMCWKKLLMWYYFPHSNIEFCYSLTLPPNLATESPKLCVSKKCSIKFIKGYISNWDTSLNHGYEL